MIVLKATQEKVLGVLQSVAEIVERWHMLSMLANVLLRKSGAIVSGGTLVWCFQARDRVASSLPARPACVTRPERIAVRKHA